MAHKIILDGVEHRLAIAEFSDDHTEVKIYPYTQEVHSTAFIDGKVEITQAEGKYGYKITED